MKGRIKIMAKKDVDERTNGLRKTKRKRGNGEGSIFKAKGETLYTAQLPVDGRSSPLKKRFELRRDADIWLTQQKTARDSGKLLIKADTPLGLWWDEWIGRFKILNVSQASQDSYKYSRARLSEKLLATPVGKITTELIQDDLNRLTQAGRSYRTVKTTRMVLSMVLRAAVDKQMIIKNPCAGTILPRNNQAEPEPLTAIEKDALLEKLLKPVHITAKGTVSKSDLASQTIRDAVLLVLKTGIRRQECVDLDWSDWNGTFLHVRGTKTEAADRFIPIIDQDALAMLARRRGLDESMIFTTRRGTRLPPTALLKYMKREADHNVHELRHTFCTDSARAGVRSEVLQTMTGHKDIETLLKIYTHVSEQDKLDAIFKLHGRNSTVTPKA
jgi:integrase